jgi:hypothetical protein
MKGHIIGYIRVSTFEQNTDRQLEGIKLDKVFTDKASGKDTKSPALDAIEVLTDILKHIMDYAEEIGGLVGFHWAMI